MSTRRIIKAVLLLPVWIVGSLFLWMFVGFGLPGVSDYSDSGWTFVNFVLPVMFVAGYLVVAWRTIRREDR